MELNLSHENIRINESVYDGTLEQSIEQDYSLPDYYPGIFKVLKTTITPCVYNCRTSGDKLVVDGVIFVDILYLGEENNQLHSIQQKYPFSKTADIKGECNTPIICYSTSGDYINCRVINPRRVDLRGAITIQIKVYCPKEEMVLSDAEGNGIQLNRGSIHTGSSHLWGTKQFSAEEQFTLEPPAEEIISYYASAVAGECKLIANKMVTKGDIILHVIYRISDENQQLQTATKTIPISQILDLPGVDEDYSCNVCYFVTGVDLHKEEDSNMINAQFDLTLCGDAYIQKDIACVTDAFSTLYESQTDTKEITTDRLIRILDDSMVSKQQVELQNIQQVIDVWGKVRNLSAKSMEDHLDFTGELEADILAVDSENNPVFLTKEIPIEFQLSSDQLCENPIVQTKGDIVNMEYSFNGTIFDLEAEIKLCGTVSCRDWIRIVTDFSIDETAPKETKNRPALTIYYADGGESLWDIARHYNTSMDAIMEENAMERPIIEERRMMLIPIVE